MGEMNLLWDQTLENRLRDKLAPLLSGSPLGYVADLPGASEAWLTWLIARATNRTVVWIGDGPRTMESAYRDLQTLLPPDSEALLLFPSWELLPAEKSTGPDLNVVGTRLEALSALLGPAPRVVVTCAQALMERTLSRTAFEAHSLVLGTGDESDPVELAERLAQAGYRFAVEVQAQGEAALRGGVLDVWPLSEEWPLRVEFFGAQVESIRVFDPSEQRSISPRTSVRLPPADEWTLMRKSPDNRSLLLDYLPDELVILWSDMDGIRAHTDVYESTIRESHTESFIGMLAAIEASLNARTHARQVFIGARPNDACPEVTFDFRGIAPIPSISGRHALPPDVVETSRNRFLTGVVQEARQGRHTAFFLDSQGTHDRLREVYPAVFGDPSVITTIGPLSGGFSSAEFSLTVVGESDLYGRKLQGKRLSLGKAPPASGARITDWTDMEPGNLVVHIDHGVGRYLGLREITVNNQLQEALAIEYAEGAKLYVPVSHAHLLTRYVGVGKRTAALHQLGGKRWNREKLAAEKGVQDLAASLLETQAARDSQNGFAFPADTPWQYELESAFPYQETDDQVSAIREVKHDMESSRPMDRLLCGDAGYGKTEVALRAAFKAVMSGKQVAVLVPTTILAQQHFQTFSERIAPFPVRIEMLSRFGTHGENAAIIQGLRDGTVDIVIGTHSLIQPDVSFRDLGLVIIDEEQRFGVLHKERFKHIRRLVDVLTLTATPIPRTLYMSLTGARDLSTIQTPPQERVPVETIVTPAHDAVVREAILRELNREGQAFYLHNRVRTIERVRDRLQRLVPEARIDIGHGQMSAGVLSDVMRRFSGGDFDVLLCTTIIESGLDITNANTILIDRADRFGLSELYQLRGRVGRSKHKGYAYMLLPTQAHVDPTARKRIQAIKQYSGAGAGFRLAMRDLEIRGTGNLLGAEQSGYIAAVGFGLYCQLLRHTIAIRKGEPLPPVIDVEVTLDFLSLSPSDAGAQHSALIPIQYIDDERLRVSMYRRIAETGFVKEVRSLRKAFRDRFGPLPAECERLLKLAELRILAAGQSIRSIQVEDGKIMLKRHNDYLMKDDRFPRLKAVKPDARLDELLTHLRHMSA
jgi:transcription-repair coupling factor (superfamily II helicase)